MTYTPDPKKNGYPGSLRRQAVLMSLDGLNLRRVARLLSVNHESVANWLTADHAELQAPHPQLYTFAGSKAEWNEGGPTSARR